jgi:signal transduction histidine kinase
MTGKDTPSQGSSEDTQTIHLDSLFTKDVSSTGSFDIRGDIWASTFGKVVQALPVPALLIDEYHDVIIANQACKKISPDYNEILDAPFARLFPNNVKAEKAGELLNEVFSSRKPLFSDSALQIGKGRIWARMTFRPIRIIDVRFALLVIEDLTVEKQQHLENKRLREELEKRVEQRTIDLRESNERLRLTVAEEKRAREALNRSEQLLQQVFDTMSSGVLVLGKNRKILHVNRSARSLLRLEDNIIGKALNEVLPYFNISSTSMAFSDLAEARITRPDGTSRIFEFSAVPLETDERIVIVFRDITVAVESHQQKRRAEELALVGELTSRLSHEIKNPLASIVMGLKTLQRGTRQSTQHGLILQMISEEVDSLTRVVNQVLESARPRTPAPRPVYVEPLLERCMDANGLLAISHGISLELIRFPSSSTVIVDDRAMLRVLGIMVHNALDACSKGDLIRVGWRELDTAEKNQLVPGFTGKVVGLFVEDCGAGIPDELSSAQSQIFKAFVSTKVLGSGLGLTVARDIVESHGGVIVVNSRFDRGTRVEILLPSPEAIPCWDWHRNRVVDCTGSREIDCATCEIKSNGTGYCCWSFEGRSRNTDTLRWPERCIKCGFFRTSSLSPVFRSRLVTPRAE